MNPCHDDNNDRLAAFASAGNFTSDTSEKVVHVSPVESARFEKAVHLVYTRYVSLGC